VPIAAEAPSPPAMRPAAPPALNPNNLASRYALISPTAQKNTESPICGSAPRPRLPKSCGPASYGVFQGNNPGQRLNLLCFGVNFDATGGHWPFTISKTYRCQVHDHVLGGLPRAKGAPRIHSSFGDRREPIAQNVGSKTAGRFKSDMTTTRGWIASRFEVEPFSGR
jgi:hypothetical protein